MEQEQEQCMQCKKLINADDLTIIPVRMLGKIVGFLCGDECKQKFIADREKIGGDVLATKWLMDSSIN